MCVCLIWCLCFSLWSMLKSEFCQLASMAVPQLLHALSLSHGADIFWNLINTNFNSKDWKIRFEAGERWCKITHVVYLISAFASQDDNIQCATSYAGINTSSSSSWSNLTVHFYLYFASKVVVVVYERTDEGPQSAYIIHYLNHCLPTSPPPPVVMVTVWLKQAAKRNCGINMVFLALWLAETSCMTLRQRQRTGPLALCMNIG